VSRGLAGVSTTSIERLRAGLATDRVQAPLSWDKLIAFGLRERLDALTAALGGHAHEACLSLLDAVLAERAKYERPAPELVWTGPEGAQATARDTAVILRELFEGARRRVVLAGYSFYNATEVLGPLHAAMRERGVARGLGVPGPHDRSGVREQEPRPHVGALRRRAQGPRRFIADLDPAARPQHLTSLA
jgi:hypothetical protein